MNKKVLLLIALCSMVIAVAGLPLSAMEEPPSTVQTRTREQVELEMKASTARLTQLTQVFVGLSQRVQAGQKDYTTMIRIAAFKRSMNQKKRTIKA